MTARSDHVLDRLRFFLEDELSAVDSEDVRRHLHHCPSCRKAAEELQKVYEILRADPPARPLRPVWPDVEERLRRSDARRLAFVSGVAAAAGLLIALLIGQRPDDTQSSAWSPLGFALSSDRDTAVTRFASSSSTTGDSES